MKQSSNTIMACPQASQGAGLSTVAPPKTGRGLPFPSLTQLFGYPALVHVFTNRNVLLVVLLSFIQTAQAATITVSQDGKGAFKTIQEAINSLPDSAATDRIILIKNGTYNEKVFITKHHIALVGESRDKTILTYDIARDAWRCDHADDWGVATLNLSGSDITLQNLTVMNGYGYNHKQPETIDCKSDSTGKRVATPQSSAWSQRQASRAIS